MPHGMMSGEVKPKSRGNVYMVGKKAPALKVGSTVTATLSGTVESIRQDAEGYDVGLKLSGAEFAASAKKSSSMGEMTEEAKQEKAAKAKEYEKDK